MADNTSSGRTRSQIEADLGASRDRLTASVEALIDQVHPNRIKQRQIAAFKQMGGNQGERQVVAFQRSWRSAQRPRRYPGRAAAGLIAFVLIVRGIARRGRKS